MCFRLLLLLTLLFLLLLFLVVALLLVLCHACLIPRPQVLIILVGKLFTLPILGV